MHSALQSYCNDCCLEAGTPSFKLADQLGYKEIYQIVTSKRAVGAVEPSISAQPRSHLTFTRDQLFKLARDLQASSSMEDTRALSMLLTQIQLVARGDDIRPLMLSHLGMTELSTVGEWHWQLLAKHDHLLWCLALVSIGQCESL